MICLEIKSLNWLMDIMKQEDKMLFLMQQNSQVASIFTHLDQAQPQ